MKTITLVAYNRLDYLKQMIESLRRNNLEGYTFFIGVEPDASEVVQFLRGLDFMRVHLTVNSTRLGVSSNPFATISRAFDAGSEFNLALEDDLILSPDALDLVNWFHALPNNDYFSLNLFNYDSDPVWPNEVEESPHFAPLGWAVTSRGWNHHFKPNWTKDARGWDWSINGIAGDSGSKRILQPKLARSNHLGREGGIHCTPEFHDRTFSRLPISAGTHRSYRLGMP